jgi:hypothetical protein
MSKCISQVHITLKICHFHLKLIWNIFNIKCQMALKINLLRPHNGIYEYFGNES